MKKKLQKSGEKKNKSVLKTVLVLLLAFGLYGVVTGYGAYKTNLTSNYAAIDKSVDITIDNIAQSLSMIQGTNISLSGSASIEAWRKDDKYFKSDDKDKYLRIEELTSEMQKTLIYNNGWNLDLIDYVTVYENDDLLTYTYTKAYNVQTIKNQSEIIAAKIRNQKEYSQIFSPTEEDPTIYTTLRIQGNFETLNSIYIICATSESYFTDIINTTTGYDNALMYLVDKNGIVYASNEEGMLGTKISDNVMALTSQDVRKDFMVDGVPYAISKKNVNSNFSFVYMLPKNEIIKETLLGMRSILLLSVITTIIMVVLVTMIETQYKQRILQEETEIRFLQQQMNPHFLFNILLTIQIKAKMNGDEPVSRMITSLSNLLRAGIYGDKRSVISVKEELKYVEYYLSLQKERYEDRLSYQIVVNDDELFDCEVPRLSVEPLVENAVVHGIEESDKDGEVDIIVSRDRDDLVIHVKDNGVGFDPESLKLDDGESSLSGQEREKVGVKNTNQRLKLMYGREYGLKINSAPNEGTDVVVRIPKKKRTTSDD